MRATRATLSQRRQLSELPDASTMEVVDDDGAPPAVVSADSSASDSAGSVDSELIDPPGPLGAQKIVVVVTGGSVV